MSVIAAIDRLGSNSGVCVVLERGDVGLGLQDSLHVHTSRLALATYVKRYEAHTADEVSDDAFVQDEGYRRGAQPAYWAFVKSGPCGTVKPASRIGHISRHGLGRKHGTVGAFSPVTTYIPLTLVTRQCVGPQYIVCRAA